MSVESQTQTVPAFFPRRITNTWMVRITLIIVSIFILTNLIAALLLAGYQIYYDGLIYPGVHVWGVDVSGRTPAEAASALNGEFTYPQMTTITFRDGESVWPVSAAELGIQFDVERTVQNAYQVGRQPNILAAVGQQIQAWRTGLVVSPVLVYDQSAADVRMQMIAAQINRPAIDANLIINGTDVSTTPAQIGRQVDMAATMSNLNFMITRLEDGEVPVVVIETKPQIMDAEAAAQTARAILASDIIVKIPDAAKAAQTDAGPWLAERNALAAMILLDREANEGGEGQHYTVRLNEDLLRGFLNPLIEQLDREPVNARFVFDERAKTIAPVQASIQGRHLNVPSTIQMINQMAPTADHEIPLVFDMIAPGAPDTATGQQLGVTEMISSATTYFSGSSEARRANIATAAAKFNGLMIAPGEEVSYSKYLGDVSAETGFTEGLIIYNGRTIKGIGGGVCQTSTTAFQAAFYAGFPINERTPHGYWVHYYDGGEGKGMDATVYTPVVDLKFTNDTPYWLLIETFYDSANSSLTYKFFSTSDGRTVQKDGPYVSNIVPHGPSHYEENPELAAGQVKQVEWPVDGFDVVVNRTVYKDGAVLYQDRFFSQYIPWDAVYQVAPGSRPN